MVIMMKDDEKSPKDPKYNEITPDEATGKPTGRPVERGGPKGPEPTRFGDWESGGRCTDF